MNLIQVYTDQQLIETTVYLIQVYTDQLIETTVYLIQVYTAAEIEKLWPVDWNYSVPNTSIRSSWNRKTVYLIQVYTDQLIETTVYLLQVYTDQLN